MTHLTLSETINLVLSQSQWGTPLGNYVAAAAVFIVTLLCRRLFTSVIFVAAKQFTKKTPGDWDDRLISALRNPTSMAVLMIGTFWALTFFHFTDQTDHTIRVFFRALSTVVIIWAINKALGVGANMLQEHGKEKGLAIATFAPLFKQIIVAIVAIIGIIMIFETLGFSVSSIIAAVGIGGAAIAFASQDTIANLYGSVAIALDRPFKVGDAVKIGSIDPGVIENIGLRSTQLRTFTKSLISIPNNTVANEVIDNFTLMTNRRINPVIGVEYGTTKAQIEAIIEDMKELMKKLSEEGELLEEPQWVYFAEFGDSSLNIMTVCYTTAGGFQDFLRVREKFNYGVMGIVEKHGSSFAFPTRTLHMFNHSTAEIAAPQQ